MQSDRHPCEICGCADDRDCLCARLELMGFTLRERSGFRIWTLKYEAEEVL